MMDNVRQTTLRAEQEEKPDKILENLFKGIRIWGDKIPERKEALLSEPYILCWFFPSKYLLVLMPHGTYILGRKHNAEKQQSHGASARETKIGIQGPAERRPGKHPWPCCIFWLQSAKVSCIPSVCSQVLSFSSILDFFFFLSKLHQRKKNF